MPTYTNWYYHGDKPVQLTAAVPNLTTTSTNAGRSTKPGENMHAMLCDVFGKHDASVDNCDSQVVGQGDEEKVNEEAADNDVLKYHKLLKKPNIAN